MNIQNEIKIKKAGNQYRQSIISLLQSEKLPEEDLPPVLENFCIAVLDNYLVGVIGLQQYDNCGLLRSMVVNDQYRNKSIASRLVSELEEKAGSLGIDCIYLLPETASSYFERKRYEKINRAEVPKSMQASSE